MLISVTLALAGLEEQMQVIAQARAVLDQEIATRDDAIRDMREAGIPYPKLMKITQLSRERLVQIVNTPS